MSTIAEATEELAAALRLVPTMSPGSVYLDPSAPNLRCPALVIGAPGFDFNGPLAEPTDARIPVYVVVDQEGQRAVEDLRELVLNVSAAVHEHTKGAVVSAEPFPFPSGTTDLPSYQIIVEVPLT